MSFDLHSRRFSPRRMFPAIETDVEETSEAPDESLFCSDDESPNDPAGQDFDDALEQIASEGCCVCPLRGDRGERRLRVGLKTIRRDGIAGRQGNGR